MLRRRSLNWEMSAPATNAWSPAPRRTTTRIASSLARSRTYSGMSCHISRLTALRFSGWLKMIQPIGPSFSSSSFGVSLMALSWSGDVRATFIASGVGVKATGVPGAPGGWRWGSRRPRGTRALPHSPGLHRATTPRGRERPITPLRPTPVTGGAPAYRHRWPNFFGGSAWTVGWGPLRYPDPAVQVLDPSFAQYRLPSRGGRAPRDGLSLGRGAGVVRRRALSLWSDIPNNRVMKWEEETGAVSVFRKPSNNTNGNTRDRQGRLVSCEHDARRVTRTEHDGTITVLADRYQGKLLNSPNDLVCKSDGSMWFSDPTLRDPRELRGPCRDAGAPDQRLSVDGRTGEVTAVTTEIRATQRPLLQPGRVEALRRRERRDAARDPGVRRRTAGRPSPTAGCS